MGDSGERLGSALADRYSIEQEIGRGAMATVYRAHDLRHRRQVAVKVIRPEIATGVGADRFLREIEIAARLSHPHILPLYDSGEVEGILYYVMPHVEGESLRHRLDREKQLSVEEAVRIAREVASALDYAHQHGVVHRDIKPHNILLSSGQAVVADFGIAWAIGTAGGDAITQTGLTLGSPAYMSPEQAAGGEVDGRSDIYSLGCVLYEMLAGQPPFMGATVQQILGRHMVHPVPELRAARPSVDRAIEQSISRALAKVPADRFATAAQFANALTTAGPLHDTAGPASTTVLALRRYPWLRVAVPVLAVAAVVAAAWAFRARPLEFLQESLGASEKQALDTSRYAVLPFIYHPRVRSPLHETQLLHDALARWRGISLVDPFQVGDALARRDTATFTSRDARDVALGLGAGRYIRGDVSRIGDSLWVHGGSYDTRTNAVVSERTVKLGLDQAHADSVFAVLVEYLLFGSDRPGARDLGRTGTRSLPARQAYVRAHAAIEGWDLVAADSHFADATQHDPQYAEAFLWLAQVRAWNGDAPATWRHAAERAAASRHQLRERDQQLSDAMAALARGETTRACALWAQLTVLEPADFAAWYGSANCLRRDNIVVKDATSPSKWRFRSSYHSALVAYRRAFQLLPSIHRAFRGSSYQDLRRLLHTSGKLLRRGRALPPDTSRFSANPSWQGDTLAFIPWPTRDVAEARPWTVPQTVGEAVRHQQELFRDIAASWVAALPRSVDAVEALGVSLEMLGDPSAVDTIRRARAMATDREERLRLAVSEVMMQVKFAVPFDLAQVRSARLLADSLLRAHPTGNVRDPTLLASLAALTGRATLAAKLSRNTALITALEIPAPIAPSAPALLAFAALGGPADSLRALEQRVASGIDNRLQASARPAARDVWLMRPATLAFPDYQMASISTLAGRGDYLLDAQADLLRGDTAAVRRTLADLKTKRRFFRPADLAIDALFPEAHLLMAIGEYRGAIDWIDPSLNSLAGTAPRAFVDIAWTGSLVRAMALRAELAQRTNDRAGARQWGAIVAALWSDADPFLQPLVNRMQGLMN